MIVLMRVTEDDRDGTGALAETCFRKFRDTFYEYTHDKEVYLYDPTDEEDVAAAIGFADGAGHPETILGLARGWNAKIEAIFDASLKQLTEHADKDPDGNVRWLAGRACDIYQMKKAAMALDGQVNDYADHALLINHHMYPTAIIEPDEMTAIEADPGSYVTFEVYPK